VRRSLLYRRIYWQLIVVPILIAVCNAVEPVATTVSASAASIFATVAIAAPSIALAASRRSSLAIAIATASVPITASIFFAPSGMG